MTKTELFLKLANPDQNGCSRWINTSEFVGEYAELKFGNGASWARKESTLAKKYIIEFDKSITSGNGIDRIRLNGLNDGDSNIEFQKWMLYSGELDLVKLLSQKSEYVDSLDEATKVKAEFVLNFLKQKYAVLV